MDVIKNKLEEINKSNLEVNWKGGIEILCDDVAMLTKALSLAVEKLEQSRRLTMFSNEPYLHNLLKEALKSIAEILSGGGEKK